MHRAGMASPALCCLPKLKIVVAMMKAGKPLCQKTQSQTSLHVLAPNRPLAVTMPGKTTSCPIAMVLLNR